MGMGWVVLAVVKRCSDGALDVRRMRSFLFSERLMHVSAQMSESHAELIEYETSPR